MAEMFPLEACAVPGAAREVPHGAPVAIAERRPGSFVEICLWSPSDKHATAIAEAVGCRTLPEQGRLTEAPGNMLLSAGPDRYFAIGREAGLADRIAAGIAATDGAVVDLSHGRAGLRLEGAAAEPLLQKGLAFDLSSAAFPPGATTTGAIHHMAVTVARLGDETFDVFVMSSLAGSIWHWVTDAAVEYGWRVREPLT